MAVAPDGKRVAWIEGMRDGGDILVAPINDLKNTQHVSAAARLDQHCVENDITWAPDAKSLIVGGNTGTTVGLWRLAIDGS